MKPFANPTQQSHGCTPGTGLAERNALAEGAFDSVLLRGLAQRRQITLRVGVKHFDFIRPGILLHQKIEKTCHLVLETRGAMDAHRCLDPIHRFSAVNLAGPTIVLGEFVQIKTVRQHL